MTHMRQGDHFTGTGVYSSSDGKPCPPAAVGVVNTLGQLPQEEAARKLFVELAESFLFLQEIS